MDEVITTGMADELVVPSRTAISRRDVLKRLGAGGLAVASAAVLSPLGAEAAYPASFFDLPFLSIDRSGRDALIRVSYSLRLSKAACVEIASGTYRYGVRFRLLDGDGDRVREWSTEPLPAKTAFGERTTHTMGWSSLRYHGTAFKVVLQVYKKPRLYNARVTASVSTSTQIVRI